MFGIESGLGETAVEQHLMFIDVLETSDPEKPSFSVSGGPPKPLGRSFFNDLQATMRWDRFRIDINEELYRINTSGSPYTSNGPEG